MSEFAVALLAMIISAISVVIAVAALTYARRQAQAAEASATSAQISADAAAETARIVADEAEAARHGWQIERNGRDTYLLRNTGTVGAHEVQLNGNFSPIGFDPQTPGVMVNIGSGQAATFWAATDMQNPGGDIVITWRNQLVEGQAELGERRGWTEQLPSQ